LAADPEGEELAPAEGEEDKEIIITVSGTKQRRWIDANGRILAEAAIGNSLAEAAARGTFDGDMAEAKRAAVIGDRFERPASK
jgi:hypothetical protein